MTDMNKIAFRVLLRCASEIKTVDTGRRIEFHFPFNRDVMSKLKARGAKWDPDKKVWYIGKKSKHLQRALDYFEEAKADLEGHMTKKQDFKKEVHRRKSEGLAIKIPFEYKDLAKQKGGIWDKFEKKWIMPDQESKDFILHKVQEAKDSWKALTSPSRTPSTPRVDYERQTVESIAERRGFTWDDVIKRIYAYERGSRGVIPDVGMTFRDKKTQRVYEVVHVTKAHYIEEGRSFGHDFDDGYVGDYYSIPASPEKVKEKDEADAKALNRQQAHRYLLDLAKHIQDKGQRPPSGSGTKVTGIEVGGIHDRLRLYGGGSWFVIDTDSNRDIWYIQNNSADGDMWAASNTDRNEIGYRIPFDPEIAKKLLACHETLIGKTPKRR
jgi:hypothetical protein